ERRSGIGTKTYFEVPYVKSTVLTRRLSFGSRSDQKSSASRLNLISAAASVTKAGVETRMIMMGENYPVPGSSPSLPVSATLPTNSGFADTTDGNGPPPCTGCGQPIQDEFILRVQGHLWHAHCLRCVVCQASLGHMCYVRGSRVFCRLDFFRLFGASCAGCGEVIPPSEVVRRAHENIYHLRCFSCVMCGVEFNTGDEFYLRDDGRLLCKADFQAARDSNAQGNDEGSSPGPRQPTTQRPLSKQETEVLRKVQCACPNPSPDLIQRISAEHGMDVRCVREWFMEQHLRRTKSEGQGRRLGTDYDLNVNIPDCSDQMDRVVAPPGGYPLPIVNEALSGGRLPTSTRSDLCLDVPFHMQTPCYPKTPCAWSLSEEMWNPDFVPPNVNLDPCDIKNGEVCDTRRVLTPAHASVSAVEETRVAFTFTSGRGSNCGGQQHQQVSRADGGGMSWINC
ncbi:hypothetical protein BaRGS_00030292, partial [Batillaria attramentaria]